MCGFVGYVSTSHQSGDVQTVKAMADLIAHRGPDGEGFWAEGPVALGHRRLAILDLSEVSNQPMLSADGRYVLVFNGEIYNFRELRESLRKRGYRFTTQGDSEVLLSAFEADGVDAFQSFNGMFTCAIMDLKTGVLTLARDRFGVKPLYYTAQNGVFAFASEVKAFKGHPDIALSLNPEGLAEYLTFMNFIASATLFKNVYLFPAGSYIQIDTTAAPRAGTRLKPVQFWDFNFTGNDPNYSAATDADRWAEQIHSAFETAVHRQLVSDVGYSSFLSGGVDSGSITAVAAKFAQSEQRDLNTFTAYFDYEGASEAELKFDERNDARLMSNTFGTRHHECPIGPADFERVAETLIYHLDEPRVGQSYPNYLVSGLVRQHETVTLSGAGGDELFGGYPWRYYQGLPADNFGDYVDGYYAYWRRLAKTDAELAALTQPISGDIKGFDGRAIFEDIYPKAAHSAKMPEELLNWTLYFEAKTFLNGLLVVEDKVSMAHSLETRVPFLDNDLVELAQRVPIQAKLGDIAGNLHRRALEKAGTPAPTDGRRDDGKVILRHMMKDLVPRKIYENKKQGFSAPDGTWFARQSYGFVAERLLDSKRRIFDMIDANEVRSVVEGHHAGTRNDGRHKIWAFLHLADVIDNFGL